MLVYDIETTKAVPDRAPNVAGIEYCGGWEDHANMGISVICAYDYTTDRYRVLTVAEAALMPNPNATGVFTKITQRIPVRIDLDPGDTHLRPGSMVRVAIERRKAEK